MGTLFDADWDVSKTKWSKFLFDRLRSHFEPQSASPNFSEFPVSQRRVARSLDDSLPPFHSCQVPLLKPVEDADEGAQLRQRRQKIEGEGALKEEGKSGMIPCEGFTNNILYYIICNII